MHLLGKIFNFFFPVKKTHITKGSSYAILRGDYYGEIFVFFHQEDDTLFFVSLPKMEIRKVDIVKFNIGLENKILDFVNIVPPDVYKLVKIHGKNTMSK